MKVCSVQCCDSQHGEQWKQVSPLETELTKSLKPDLALMRGSDCCSHCGFDQLHCSGHLKRQLCLKLLHDLSAVV